MTGSSEVCPLCGADLRGEAIPDDQRTFYDGESAHFLRVIGVEIPEEYDGVLYWQCPDCHGAWSRWMPSTGLGRKAQVYVDIVNERLLRDDHAD